MISIDMGVRRIIKKVKFQQNFFTGMRIFQRAFSSIIDNIPKPSYTDAFHAAINTTKDKLAFNFITPKRIVQPTNSFTVSITANRNNTLCFLFDKQGNCW